MFGSPEVDALSFLEKFFLYGSAICRLRAAFDRRLPAVNLVATLLFVTSWLEVHLPDRSAEITDGIMALLIGLGFALLPSDREPPVWGARSLSAQERRVRDWQAHARAHGVKIDG